MQRVPGPSATVSGCCRPWLRDRPRRLELVPGPGRRGGSSATGIPITARLNPLLSGAGAADDGRRRCGVRAARRADAVAGLTGPGMLAAAYTLHEFTPGDGLHIGPFSASTPAPATGCPSRRAAHRRRHGESPTPGQRPGTRHTRLPAAPTCWWPGQLSSTRFPPTTVVTCPARATAAACRSVGRRAPDAPT